MLLIGMATNIERIFAMTTIKTLSRNKAAKTTEVLEAEMAGDVIVALAQFVATRKSGEDRTIAISVINKAFMHENTSWDNLGHKMYGSDTLGRKGQADFFMSVLEENGLLS